MRNSKKILQLGKFYPIKGGVEKVMYDLTTGLSEMGIDCDMMCANDKSSTEPINEHAQLISCNTWFEAASTKISPSMISHLKQKIDDYDIVHIHHPDPMACLALMLSGYKGKVALQWHSDIVRQKKFLSLYLPLQRWLIRRANIIIGTSPAYIAHSPYLKDVQQKTVILPIGIDPMRPDPEKMQKIQENYGNKKIVFSLGRFVHYKGYGFLVEAAMYLPDDYIVLIGGNGPLRKELQAQINRGNLSKKVKLIGRIPADNLPNYYGACKVFCLSSVQKTEAFGIVQIEAMSCGKPVIATNIPESGVPWVNIDKYSGRNVAPRDAKALAAAIMEVAEDDATYERYCSNSLHHFTDHFTKDEMIRNCIDIYSKI